LRTGPRLPSERPPRDGFSRFSRAGVCSTGEVPSIVRARLLPAPVLYARNSRGHGVEIITTVLSRLRISKTGGVRNDDNTLTLYARTVHLAKTRRPLFEPTRTGNWRNVRKPPEFYEYFFLGPGGRPRASGDSNSASRTYNYRTHRSNAASRKFVRACGLVEGIERARMMGRGWGWGRTAKVIFEIITATVRRPRVGYIYRTYVVLTIRTPYNE